MKRGGSELFSIHCWWAIYVFRDSCSEEPPVFVERKCRAIQCGSFHVRKFEHIEQTTGEVKFKIEGLSRWHFLPYRRTLFFRRTCKCSKSVASKVSIGPLFHPKRTLWSITLLGPPWGGGRSPVYFRSQFTNEPIFGNRRTDDVGRWLPN